MGTRQRIALFDKCRRYTRAREAQAAGLYPYFKPISDADDTVAVIEGKSRVMLGSNNYLGLTHHPRVLEAARDALLRYGSGCTGSRFLNGTLSLHERLEEELADFLGTDAVLVFSTGYQANLGVVAGLVGRGDVVYFDKLDHASIVDGARLAFGEAVRFPHGDLRGLDRRLERHDPRRGALLIVDGVYSMDGDVADLPGLVERARRHGAALAVDEAHALGVLGPGGEGSAAHFELGEEVDLVVGTFSKSLASIGGFVAGTEEVIHYLKHHARPLIFTAALPASNTAGVLAALQVMRTEPERREQLWKNTRRLQSGLRRLGYDIGRSETPIVPIRIGAVDLTFRFWRQLYELGVFTNPVVPPAVPDTESRLRCSLMATHTCEQIDFALEVFAETGKELGVV